MRALEFGVIYTPTMKTFSAKNEEVQRGWYVVDASDKTLGRLASDIAYRLRGKHKAEYTPHVDTGDYIVVVNAASISVTGRKMKDKMYHHHTGYPGGLKSISLEKLLEKAPERALQNAVKGMLPKNPLGRQMFRKLKVYPGAEHPHSAQQPETLDFEQSRQEFKNYTPSRFVAPAAAEKPAEIAAGAAPKKAAAKKKAAPKRKAEQAASPDAPGLQGATARKADKIAFGGKKYNLDDLKIVEGIGPKIEGLLNDAGISSWEDLANAELDKLRDILAAAGSRYAVHDPGTWAKQSALCVKGDWDELKAYQDALDGGKEAG